MKNTLTRFLRAVWRFTYGGWLTLHALVLDRPFLAWPLWLPARQNGAWATFHNRGEQLRRSPDYIGYEPCWDGPTALRISQRLPRLSERILQSALHEWPIGFCANRQDNFSGAPDVSFIVGHRGETRLPHLLRTIETLFAQEECDCEIVVVEQDAQPLIADRLPPGVRYLFDPCNADAPYNRSRSFNIGARNSRGRVVVLHDNDLLAPTRYAAELVRLADAGYEAMKIYRFIFYLRGEATSDVLMKGRLSQLGLDRIAHNNVGGSVAMLRTSYFAIGGYDESFVGWGFEDEEMFDRCRTRACYPYGYMPLIHLDHEPQSTDCLAANRRHLNERRTVAPLARAQRLSSQMHVSLSRNGKDSR